MRASSARGSGGLKGLGGQQRGLAARQPRGDGPGVRETAAEANQLPEPADRGPAVKGELQMVMGNVFLYRWMIKNNMVGPVSIPPHLFFSNNNSPAEIVVVLFPSVSARPAVLSVLIQGTASFPPALEAIGASTSTMPTSAVFFLSTQLWYFILPHKSTDLF